MIITFRVCAQLRNMNRFEVLMSIPTATMTVTFHLTFHFPYMRKGGADEREPPRDDDSFTFIPRATPPYRLGLGP